jgi:hypothetical protein
VDDFSLETAAAVAGSAAFFALLAVVTFRAGLRRYTSGALWTRA